MARVKRLLKLILSAAVWLWDFLCDSVRRLLGRPSISHCVVLYYHEVPAHQRRLFARQMDVLLSIARPISTDPRDVLAPGGHYAAVTFDDGFLSVVENALPELRRRQIPWTMFVPSGCLGQRPNWLRHAAGSAHQDRVVSEEELRMLSDDPLVRIGSHTVGHANLLEIGPAQASVEMAQSKSDLESLLQKEVCQLSYPFGARSPALDQIASDLGYRRVFSSEPVRAFPRPDALVNGRVSVTPSDWPLEFRLKVAGAYRWGSPLQKMKRKLRH